MRVRLIRPSYWTDRPESVSACAVYRLYSLAGDLLYVGMGYEPAWRIERHARRGWGAEIASATIDWYPSRDEASRAERLAIIFEGPAYNVHRYAEWAAAKA